MAIPHESRPLVVGLGEVLWDCIGDERHPGGAPANVAFHAAQLGLHGIICSRVGQDVLGDEFVEFVKAQGLTADYVQRDDTLPTGRATVDASVPGRPQFVIHENVAWDRLAFDDSTRALMERAAAVCFGTLGQRSEASRRTIRQCLAATRPGCVKVFDVNLRQHYYTRECVEQSLAAADLVKLNIDEVSEISRLLAWTPAGGSIRSGDGDEAGLVPFARSVCERFSVEAVCITRAERGCLACAGDEVIDLPGRSVEVVDAVGAGDAFTAALIYARLSGWPLQRACAFANEVGALVATRSGAMPPLRCEFEVLKERSSGIHVVT